MPSISGLSYARSAWPSGALSDRAPHSTAWPRIACVAVLRGAGLGYATLCQLGLASLCSAGPWHAPQCADVLRYARLAEPGAVSPGRSRLAMPAPPRIALDRLRLGTLGFARWTGHRSAWLSSALPAPLRLAGSFCAPPRPALPAELSPAQFGGGVPCRDLLSTATTACFAVLRSARKSQAVPASQSLAVLSYVTLGSASRVALWVALLCCATPRLACLASLCFAKTCLAKQG